MNGTYLGDEPVSEEALRSGELIKNGPCILKYLAAGDIEAGCHEEIYRLTITDGLTGIANRRAFEETISAEFRRVLRYLPETPRPWPRSSPRKSVLPSPARSSSSRTG